LSKRVTGNLDLSPLIRYCSAVSK